MLYLGFFVMISHAINVGISQGTIKKLGNRTLHCDDRHYFDYLSFRLAPTSDYILTLTISNLTRSSEEEYEDDDTMELDSGTTYDIDMGRFYENFESIAFTFRVCLIGTCLLAFYEFVQFILSFKSYFFKFSNWLDATLIYLCFSVLLANPFCLEEEFYRKDSLPGEKDTEFKSLKEGGMMNYVALTVLLLSAQTAQSIAKVSIFSTSIHMAIFKKVLATFLKTISLYLLPILAFALSFQAIKEEDENFSGMYISIISTIRMMMGDFGVFTIINENTFQNTLFLLFVVLITIVLYNLLNALAISDTAQIMKHAELVDIKKRVSLIQSYDKLFMIIGITCANIFPMLETFHLRPQVDRNLLIPSDRKSERKIEETKKNSSTLFKFLNLLNPTSVFYTFSDTKEKTMQASRFEKSGYNMRKNDFNEIVNFVKAKYE